MLKYDGGLADEHALDFYDASRALVGFERTLALVTHLVVNGEIITQAPALKNAQIIVRAPEDGSWKTRAWILISGAMATAAVGKDSPVGYAVTSLFDYVMYSTMGFHVDYDKTFQQQRAEHLAQKGITESKVSSLIEKTEASVADIHRPIIASRTARAASVHGRNNSSDPLIQLGPDMTAITYEYLMQTIRSDDDFTFTGKVSSYNINTYKGRIYIEEEARTVPFELVDTAKTPKQISLITRSLRLNADDRKDDLAKVEIDAYRVESRNGRLKALHITAVREFFGL